MKILNKIAIQVGSTTFALVVSDGNSNDNSNTHKCEYSLDLITSGEINENRTFFFQTLENANLSFQDMIQVLKSQGGIEVSNYAVHPIDDVNTNVNVYAPKPNNYSLN